MVKSRLVAQPRGGYKRTVVTPKELRREGYVPERRTLWGKQRRIWVLGKKPHRLTLGLNYVWAKQYRSFTYTTFYDHEPTDREIDKAKREADAALKDSSRVGKYKKSEWWFNENYNVAVEPVEEMGRTQVYDGKTNNPLHIQSVKTANRLSFAKKMVKSGKWFKQETLKKWGFIND